MPVDASIYQNVQTPKIDIPSPLDTAQQAMTLSQLGMQQRQMQLQMQNQQALAQAYQGNVDASGNVNHQGVLSALAKTAPLAAMEYAPKVAAMQKSQAEAQSAQMDAQQKIDDFITPHLVNLKSAPDEQKPMMWHAMLQKFADQHIPVQNVPPEFNAGWLDNTLNTLEQRKSWYANQKTQADTANTNAKTGMIPTEIAEKKAQAQKAIDEAAKLRSETYARPDALTGQVDDPAKLVPYQVPKDHQAKVFGEIDAATNTKRMANSIMGSFEQAVKDTQGVGRVTSLLKEPRSSQALHQALQPTFADLEHTVRQAAMDNTFKNVTPSIGDTAADIATKRNALLSYLQSKASASTGRGYGIDLSKFDSTSAYRPPAKTAGPDASSMGTREVTAGDKPQAAPGGFSLSEIRAELARRKGGKGK